MPFPTDPIQPDEVTEGAPDPIIDDSLAAPDDADAAAATATTVDPEFDELPAPTTPQEALPMESPVSFADGGQTITLLTYLRDATEEGVLIHLMATVNGEESVELSEIELGLEFPDGQSTSTALPAHRLEPAQTWEGDLLLEPVVVDLAPGASYVRYTWGEQADRYARL